MKKFVKLFSLIALLFVAVFALSSCGAKQSKEENKYEVKIQSIVSSDEINLIKKAEWIAEGKDIDEFKEVVYLGLFDSTNGIFYLEGAVIPVGTYELVERGNGLPTLDKADKKLFGPYFAGWYQTEGLRNDGSRLVTFNEVANDPDHIIHAYYIDFVQALLVAGVCILIVFGILMLLWGLVSLLKFVAPKAKEDPKPVAAPAPVQVAPRKAISLADIKDEEMMAAALVATIDYHEETQEDVRVVSIKEIK